MGSVNKVILVGNLGKDAEVRSTPGGQSVASFSLATTENWTSRDGEKKEQTEWHRIVLWGKAADSLQPYLTKGKQISPNKAAGDLRKAADVVSKIGTATGGPGGGTSLTSRRIQP